MERAAPHVTGWPVEILGFGDRYMPDAAHDVSACVAANAGTYGSIGTLMGLDIRVPDYSTLSRRANGLNIAQAMRQAGSVAVHLVVDSTGLKIFGEGEWLAQKHKIKGIRRRWRKLHLGLDLASGAIVCADLTDDAAGDSTALPGLLDQLAAPVTGFLADGAYDGASTRDLLRETVWGDPGCGYTAAKERSDPTAIGAGPNRSGSPYCPDPQQWPYGLAGGHRVQPAQPDRNADRPLEERHRPQAQIPQLLQADHGNQSRPESSEHNDRTRTACVRTHRLTLPLGKGRIPSPPRSMQQRSAVPAFVLQLSRCANCHGPLAFPRCRFEPTQGQRQNALLAFGVCHSTLLLSALPVTGAGGAVPPVWPVGFPSAL